jgi:2-polyprenyl-3-methyl-5-hydroxy-6-metoxy-1,4-benzoquinol methylase
MPRTSYELTHCPVCDALDNVEIADANVMRSEVELLRAFHARRLRVDVPPESLTDRVAFSQYPPLRLSQCGRCTHVYRNPWERREALAAAYGDWTPTEAVLQALFATQRKAYRAQVRRLTKVTGRPGHGLEVGSYVGGFLAAARHAGWAFEGVDVNENAKEFATRSGFKVTRGEIGDVVTEQPFDVVAIWNTFEQLYDARSALVAARRLVRQGGILVVRIPNGGFYVAWRRRLRGPLSAIAMRLLAHNNLLSFPYRQGFTSRSLAMLLRECHFEVVRVFGDTLVPIADQWTTTYGAMEERIVKGLQRVAQLGWNAPWVEVYARGG